MTNSKTSRRLPEGKITIAVYMDETMAEEIDRLAEEEMRPRSMMVVVLLTEAMEARRKSATTSKR